MIPFRPADGTPLPRSVRRQPSSSLPIRLICLPLRHRTGKGSGVHAGICRTPLGRGCRPQTQERAPPPTKNRHCGNTVRSELCPSRGASEESGDRSFAIPPFVADIIGKHLGSHANANLEALAFTTEPGTPLRSANFRCAVWLPATAAIGEEGLRAHDLRRKCASLLIATDAQSDHVKEHLGHSSISVTIDVLDISTRIRKTRLPSG
jgi:hypothetical protein